MNRFSIRSGLPGVLRTGVVAVAAAAVLAACSSGSDDSSTKPSDQPTSETTTSSVRGSGTGDITGTAKGKNLADSWRVSCRDAGDGLYEINAIGSAPHTIQGKIEDGKVLELIVSFKDLLATTDSDDADLKAEQLADGFKITGDIEFTRGTKSPIDMTVTCGE